MAEPDYEKPIHKPPTVNRATKTVRSQQTRIDALEAEVERLRTRAEDAVFAFDRAMDSMDDDNLVEPVAWVAWTTSMEDLRAALERVEGAG